MKFENAQVFNIEGAMRGMRFPMKGTSTSVGDNISEKDMDLAKRLWAASEKENLAHSKFLRQILVSVDITAPLYFWSEFDTYKVGTTANSESTMHKLLKDAEKLTIADFELDETVKPFIDQVVIPVLKDIVKNESFAAIQKLRYIKQVLPTSYLQKRHWTGNYEILRNMFNQRHNHRLKEWREDFADFVAMLPYSKEFILGGFNE